VKAIPAATEIALPVEEDKALQTLAGSRKSEARMRDRAGLVLLAVSGAGSWLHAGHGVELAGAVSPNATVGHLKPIAMCGLNFRG
jgi:hypothetical protein